LSKFFNINEHLDLFYYLPNYSDFIYSFFISIILINYGKIFQKLFETSFVSSGISIFFICFYIYDFYFLFLTQNFSFRVNFLIFNLIILLISYLKKKKNLRYFAYIGIIYLFLKYMLVKILAIQRLDINQLLPDEIYFWFPSQQNILNNNLAFAISNNTFKNEAGKTLLIPHIKSTIQTFTSNHFDNVFLISISLCFFYLIIYLISELRIDLKIKFLSISLFLIISFCSTWWSHVFFLSTYGEGVTGYLYCTLTLYFVNLLKHSPFSVLVLSTLWFSKYFASIIIFPVAIFIMYKRQNLTLSKIAILCLPFLINFFNYRIILNSTKLLDGYINTSLTERVMLFQLNKLGSIFLILFKDNNLNVLILIFIFLVILGFNHKLVAHEQIFINITILTMVISVFLILILYMYVDPYNPGDSGFRYLHNFIPNLIICNSILLDKLFSYNR
jgi:hypothetical protein